MDKTQTKLIQHPNAAVKEFSLSFEPSQIYFVASSLQLTFAKIYQDCSRLKEKHLIFQVKWHQQCSILIVKGAPELSKMNVHPEDDNFTSQIMIRQQWVTFYQSCGVNHEVAKIFMLIFTSEMYNKLLQYCHTQLQQASPDNAAAVVNDDPVDVYYRFGGATLASMLHLRYKAIRTCPNEQKEKISNEIHVLQALNTSDKAMIPQYLKYQDNGFMYFPCDELLPFLKTLDTTVKAVCNEREFQRQGQKLIQETVKLVNSKSQLKEQFKEILLKRLNAEDDNKLLVMTDLFNEFVRKLTNTRIQEFLDSHKVTNAMKQGTASISGQNLRDFLLTQHVNLKSKSK